MPRRMKLADAPIGKEVADLPIEIEVTDKSEREMDISDIKAEIERICEERRNAEKQAKEEGRRVEKRTRQKIRRPCCSCGEMTVVKSDGETRCCKHICATCY